MPRLLPGQDGPVGDSVLHAEDALSFLDLAIPKLYGTIPTVGHGATMNHQIAGNQSFSEP